MATIEQQYRQAMRDLGQQGRMARTAELFQAGWEILAARVLREQPDLEGEALKVAVARVMYRKDPVIVKLLDQHAVSIGP